MVFSNTNLTMNILIIEKNKTFLNLLQRGIETHRAGYQIHTAESVDQAQAVLERVAPGLTFIAHSLVPDTDERMALIAKIMGRDPNAFICLMSANGRQEPERFGVDEFIDKDNCPMATVYNVLEAAAAKARS